MKKYNTSTTDKNFVAFSLKHLCEYIPELEKHKSSVVDENSLEDIYALIYSWIEAGGVQSNLSFENLHIVDGAGVFFVFRKF